MPIDQRLREQAETFADELDRLLRGTLPNTPDIKVETSGDLLRVEPASLIPLYADGVQRGSLAVQMLCCPDRSSRYLAVQSSAFTVYADKERTPLLRFEYLRTPRSVPAAHIQVHAHRGAFSVFLAHTGHQTPHDLAALHLPVGGGRRFRPALEDVIEFLIRDCNIDYQPSWQSVLDESRDSWLRIQTAAVVRDFPDTAAEALRELGYEVTPPPRPAHSSPDAPQRSPSN